MRRIARGLLVALLGVLAAVSAASASAAHRRRPVPAPTWTSRQLLGDAPQTISCASSSFCVAVGGQDAYEYDGSEWSSFDIDSDQSLAAVSCPTSRFLRGGRLEWTGRRLQRLWLEQAPPNRVLQLHRGRNPSRVPPVGGRASAFDRPAG